MDAKPSPSGCQRFPGVLSKCRIWHSGLGGALVLPIQLPHVQSDICEPLWPGGLGSGRGDSHGAWCGDFGEGTETAPGAQG